MKTKKVLLADDHSILRQGLIRIIEDDAMFKVIAEAGDGLDALKKIKELKPDIAVIDISMPGMTGLEVAKKIQEDETIGVDIIILTMYVGKKYYKEAMNNGVKGYILKENSAADLKTALQQVASGKYFISPLISDHLPENSTEKNFLNEHIDINDLSTSEKRVLKLISENKTSKSIAEDLSLSFRTVQNHRSHICRKLGLEGMNSLLQFAIENKSRF